MYKRSKRSLTPLWLIAISSSVLFACAAVPDQGAVKPVVDTQKPTTYAEYKAWRDRYDTDAREYAEFKAWEAEYRRWQWEQQQLDP